MHHPMETTQGLQNASSGRARNPPSSILPLRNIGLVDLAHMLNHLVLPSETLLALAMTTWMLAIDLRDDLAFVDGLDVA